MNTERYAKNKSTFAGIIAVILFLSSIALAWQGEVVRVKDGDTIVVYKGSSNVDVRLYGIDTPESSQ